LPGSSRRPPGCRPTSYVILLRVGRAKRLLQTGGDFSLAEVAVQAGFSDQSQFCHHFKRLVGVTPGQFRTPARIAYGALSKTWAAMPVPANQAGSGSFERIPKKAASSSKKPDGDPPYHSS
jgi:AraC-like DNA-binding protein